MSDIHTRRKLTRTATGGYLQYADFDPTNWHTIKLQLDDQTNRARGLSLRIPGDPAPAMNLLEWLDQRGLDYRYEYAYELDDGEYKSFIIAWFPPETRDQALLFKLTHGGRA